MHISSQCPMPLPVPINNLRCVARSYAQWHHHWLGYWILKQVSRVHYHVILHNVQVYCPSLPAHVCIHLEDRKVSKAPAWCNCKGWGKAQKGFLHHWGACHHQQKCLHHADLVRAFFVCLKAKLGASWRGCHHCKYWRTLRQHHASV